jgi:hypothetical protein
VLDHRPDPAVGADRGLGHRPRAVEEAHPDGVAVDGHRAHAREPGRDGGAHTRVVQRRPLGGRRRQPRLLGTVAGERQQREHDDEQRDRREPRSADREAGAPARDDCHMSPLDSPARGF